MSFLGFSVCNRSGFPRYHTGSLAFGSLILAIVQVIRVTLEYLDHRLKGTETGLGNEEVGTAGVSAGPEPIGNISLLGDASSRCSRCLEVVVSTLLEQGLDQMFSRGPFGPQPSSGSGMGPTLSCRNRNI